MPWPLSQDYNEAIQNPAQCFSDPDLRQGEAVTNALGLPLPCSGNFADVYAIASGQGKWAVKCFTRQIPGLRERYAEISKYLPRVQLPFMVDFQFLEQGIRVRGQWYPVLKMQWVEGFTLNTFARDNLDKPQLLQTLCHLWLKLAVRLREANLAHCDLQHGNVLLVPGTKAATVGVRLVDYDGMCVPALELLKSTEVGHPSYQHPQRLREGTYGLQIDRFSYLVIYTALRSLVIGGRGLWEKFDNGDNLLFTQKDFEAPRQSRIFQELLKLDDPEIRKLVQALAIASQKPLDQVPLLDQLVPAPALPKASDGPGPRKAGVTTPKPVKEEANWSAWASRKPGRASGPRRSSVGMLLGIAGAVAVVLGIGGFLLLNNANKGGQPAHDPDAQAKLVSKSSPSPSTSQPKTQQVTPTIREVEPKKDPEPKVEPKKDPEPKVEPKKDPEPKVEPKKDPEPKVEPKKDPEPKSEQKDTRLPVPEASALAGAQKLVKTLFKEDYAKRRPADMLALSNKLVEQAAQSKDDLAARYVLLAEASHLAAMAADADVALQAMEELAKDYAIKELPMKAQVLDIVSKAATTVESNTKLVESALKVLGSAVDADDYDTADQLAKLATGAASKTKNLSLARAVQRQTQEVAALRKDFEHHQEVQAQLSKNAKDPEANLAMGKYLCLRRGNWDTGLPMLALGSDAKLKDLAVHDLAKPEAADAQVELADGWYDLSEKSIAPAKIGLQMRAHYWYLRALPMLTGLTKARVEKRAGELDKVVASAAAKQINSAPPDWGTKNPPPNGPGLSDIAWAKNDQASEPEKYRDPAFWQYPGHTDNSVGTPIPGQNGGWRGGTKVEGWADSKGRPARSGTPGIWTYDGKRAGNTATFTPLTKPVAPKSEWTFASWTANNPAPDFNAVTQGAGWNKNVSKGASAPWNDPSYMYKVGDTPIPGQNGLYNANKTYPAGRGTVRGYAIQRDGMWYPSNSSSATRGTWQYQPVGENFAVFTPSN